MFIYKISIQEIKIPLKVFYERLMLHNFATDGKRLSLVLL